MNVKESNKFSFVSGVNVFMLVGTVTFVSEVVGVPIVSGYLNAPLGVY